MNVILASTARFGRIDLAGIKSGGTENRVKLTSQASDAVGSTNASKV